MTVLYRCRTSLSEVSATFRATAPSAADWSAEVWPGRRGLVVHESGGMRRVAAMSWGVRDWSSEAGLRKDHRSSAWFRELYPSRVELLALERRCMIVVDAFAYPEGPSGARMRTWFGFDDRPIFGWAGFAIDGPAGPGFCGFLAAANDCVEPGRIMPVIVTPADFDAWFGGDLSEAARIARTTIASQGIYREPTEEPWGGDRDGARL